MKKLMLLMLAVVLYACHKDNNTKPAEEEQVRQEYRIAVVLPTEGATGNYWKKSID